jgi:hypothetical protein
MNINGGFLKFIIIKSLKHELISKKLELKKIDMNQKLLINKLYK